MMSKPGLRIAIAVRDRRVPRWQAALVSDAARLAGVEVNVLRLRPDQKQRFAAAPSLRRLDRADYLVTRRLTSVTDPLRDAFIDLPIQTANFRKAYFDIVIDLGGTLRSARALMPHRGVWSLAFGKYLARFDDYPCIEEVLGAEEVTKAALLERKEGNSAAILGEAYTAVDRHSIFVSRAQALWAAPQLVTAALRQMRDGSLAEAASLPPRKSRPPLGVSGKRAYRFFTSALDHAWRSLVMWDEWMVHYRTGADAGFKNPELAAFTALPAMKKSFLADPFVVEREGKTVIFCEEYLRNAGRGIISCVEISGGKPVGPPVRVLEKPYHLSYPFLITLGEVLYMIPESSANDTVELYRCTRFPDLWQHEATLLSGIKAVDTTLAEIGGKLWMFTAVKRPETRNFDELHVYSAARIIGPWQPHPGNPVRFDARSSRPAGALFQEEGSWIRPAQDATLRYGRRVHFQRIAALSERLYAEETAGMIDPGAVAGAAGVHTWNRSPHMSVIDSVRQIFRFGLKS